mmetsp:Transcript_2418/g.3090  ORF Transcript_2418/g.3090 Transcript_2418/m.3090 type:complete len:114 (+) Transcript_2418:677-1018(+)
MELIDAAQSIIQKRRENDTMIIRVKRMEQRGNCCTLGNPLILNGAKKAPSLILRCPITAQKQTTIQTNPKREQFSNELERTLTKQGQDRRNTQSTWMTLAIFLNAMTVNVNIA